MADREYVVTFDPGTGKARVALAMGYPASGFHVPERFRASRTISLGKEDGGYPYVNISLQELHLPEYHVAAASAMRAEQIARALVGPAARQIARVMKGAEK